MAFWGNSFVFHDAPCDEYDLMLYDIDNERQGGGEFASTVSIVEEVVGSRWKPYFYGVQFERKLTFDMIFGVNQDRLDSYNYLDRYEINVIASWLTGHKEYMWLKIEQDDMAYVRYKCMITELSIVSFGNIPWALKATVTCDGPYGYLHPQEFVYEVNGNLQVQFYNESSHNGYYMPNIEILSSGGGSFSISNATDENRVFQFTNIPASVTEIHVDNDHCVITNNQGLNLYPYFNNKFLRLKKGYNTLNITGTGTVKILCEFPVNFGG